MLNVLLYYPRNDKIIRFDQKRNGSMGNISIGRNNKIEETSGQCNLNTCFIIILV